MIPNDIQFATDIDRLSEQLETVYRDLVIGINGDISQWEPDVYGTTTSGATTYVHRSGWVWRRGLLVQLWLDIQWSGASGSGDLAISLPYKVVDSDNQPFVGFFENRSGIDFSAGYTYLTWRAETNTFQSTVRENGDNVSSQAVSLPSSGRLIGYLTYIGQEYE